MRLAAGLLAALTALAATTGTGVYTDEQAAQGGELYSAQCASCHGASMKGRGPTPPLTGPDFIARWEGMTLDDLLEKMQATMPATSPGSLTREQNASIVAAILKANQFPAGKTALPSDAEALKQIPFAAPK